MRLFFLGLPVKSDTLPLQFAQNIFECGLAFADGVLVRPMVLVTPMLQQYVVSDLHPNNTKYADQYVPTLSQPAMHLLSFAITDPGQKVLDLCGGCGPHAIFAGQFSESVTSTDSNPRAKQFVDFNSALNGIENIQAVTGDLFAAIPADKYNLILCNPPFVISPSTTDGFRDNKFELDHLLYKILCEAPRHLEEGGFFQTTCEWVQIRGEEWTERLKNWLKDNGCDAWIIEANCQAPESYASNRLKETSPDQSADSEALDQYIKYFNNKSVEAIRGGLIFLRRRAGANWQVISTLQKKPTRSLSSEIKQGFQTHDLLYSDVNDQTLLGAKLCVPEGLQLYASSSWDTNQWALDTMTIENACGLYSKVSIDETMQTLISSFNGAAPVQRVLESFALTMEIPVEMATTQGLAFVRSLLEEGLLKPSQ